MCHQFAILYDFMHYIAERRRAGVNTLFVIDEFNAVLQYLDI
jgi:hypothetical protein